MTLPRNVSAGELIRALAKLGYQETRRRGSHIRLTTQRNGQHHLTVPDHNPIRVGTLGAILRDVGAHHAMSREQLLQLLFGV